MRLSVIVPALDERLGITRCVQSAWALGADEVIVADGGSSDDTVALAERERAQTVATKQGRGRQMNAGAAEATGDVLLFLHADTWLPAGAGHQIIRVLHNSAIVHGAFRQRIDARGARYRLLEAGNAFRALRLGVPYGDQALFVRRAVFDQVGGFPDEPLMEDVVIARRLRKLGKPALVEGPLHVSARRWQCNGVVRQTLTNWGLLAAWSLGVPPNRLAAWYYATPTSAPDVSGSKGLGREENWRPSSPHIERPNAETPPAGMSPAAPSSR